jgi:long-subunit fatty acid transport protein
MRFVDRFVDHGGGGAPRRRARRGPRAGVRAGVGAALGLAAALAARGAASSPLDDPFVGGMGFTGPTSASVSDIYWNPAALGLVRGTQLMFAGTVRASSITVNRASIDPKAGALGGSFAPGSATASDIMQPVQWPIGPGTFLGVSSDLGGDRFTIGFATYMPYVEQTKYALSPAGNEPTRYQALEVDLRNLALVPALSVRFAGEFRVGVAPGFLFSTGHLMFAEDTALDQGSAGLMANCNGARCGPENPAAAGRVDVTSGNGLGDAKFSVTLGGGLYYRHQNLEVGLSYSSRPIGGSVSGAEVLGEQTTATAPPRAGGGLVTCPTGSTSRCVFGDVAYRLPDVWIGGVTWRLRPGLEVTGIARWIWFHLHDRIDVRLTGPTLETTGIPAHIVLYRGFKDVWDLRGRVSYWWRERVRIGAEVRLETSAVDPSAENAAAVDGLKVEPIVLAEVRLSRRLWLDGGYGVELMQEVTASSSVFVPKAATTCFDKGGDLDACAARNAGQARPTAAGTYTRVVQDMGLTLRVKF